MLVPHLAHARLSPCLHRQPMEQLMTTVATFRKVHRLAPLLATPHQRQSSATALAHIPTRCKPLSRVVLRSPLQQQKWAKMWQCSRKTASTAILTMAGRPTVKPQRGAHQPARWDSRSGAAELPAVACWRAACTARSHRGARSGKGAIDAWWHAGSTVRAARGVVADP